MSTDFIPALAAIIGPIVLPHAPSYLTINSCKGTSAFLASDFTRARPTESVAYL